MPFHVRMLNLEGMGLVEIVIAKQILHSLSRHMHDSLCFGIIQTGSRQCILPSGEYTAVAGQVIVINPGEVHACRSENDQPYDYSMICVKTAATMMHFLQQEELFEIPYFSHPTLQDNELFLKIFNFSHIGMLATSLLEVQTAWIDLFAHLVFGYGTQRKQLIKTTPTAQTAASEIYHYIEMHYAEEISLQQLSALFHISSYYLTRCFTKQFGLPPHICQTLFRIKQAKQLLAKGMNPAEAAAETGFVDQSHLSRRFKDVVGMTPGQWLNGRSVIAYKS